MPILGGTIELYIIGNNGDINQQKNRVEPMDNGYEMGVEGQQDPFTNLPQSDMTMGNHL